MTARRKGGAAYRWRRHVVQRGDVHHLRMRAAEGEVGIETAMGVRVGVPRRVPRRRAPARRRRRRGDGGLAPADEPGMGMRRVASPPLGRRRRGRGRSGRLHFFVWRLHARFLFIFLVDGHDPGLRHLRGQLPLPLLRLPLPARQVLRRPTRPVDETRFVAHARRLLLRRSRLARLLAGQGGRVDGGGGSGVCEFGGGGSHGGQKM